MRRMGVPYPIANWRNWLVLACLLSLAVLVGHQFAMSGLSSPLPMAHGDHVQVASMVPEASSGAPWLPCIPGTMMEHCLNPQGVLPLTPLLVLGFLLSGMFAAIIDGSAWERCSISLEPPPLTTTTRRAILQVFRI